jgi:hypothetical protein
MSSARPLVMLVAVLLAVCSLVAQSCFLRISCVILYAHEPQNMRDGILVAFSYSRDHWTPGLSVFSCSCQQTDRTPRDILK